MALTYQPSDALSHKVRDGYIARASKTAPDGARQLASQLAKHDYRKIYRGLLAGTGLAENDAADAVAAYTALGWMIANNQLTDLSPRAYQALRQQIAARAPGNSSFAPGVRAELGEEMKLLAVTLHAGWQGAQREGNLSQYSDGVAALFKRNDIDLRALRLTNNGFAAR